MTRGLPSGYRPFAVAAALLAAGAFAHLRTAEGGEPTAIQQAAEPATPEEYVVDYPAAERFCPPVETFFFEVVRTFEVVRGRRFTHQLNGGYGLPVVQQVNGRNLLHLGADVGWHRVGAPVYAVAAGVVRVSEGPSFPSAREKRSRDRDDQATGKSPGRQTMALHWGNVVTIEHRLPSGEHFTTVYGHLGTDRLVKAGDIVEAGQQIASIGRQHRYVNGGYKPHLHFGVRQGRLAEPGCELLQVRFGDRLIPVELADVTEEEIEISMPPDAPELSTLRGVRVYPVTVREGRSFVPARILWELGSRPGFAIVGYGLTTEGWYDPVAFLREYGADRNPAPFRAPKRARSGRN